MVRGKLQKEQTWSVIQDRSEYTVLIESFYSKCAARRQMLKKSSILFSVHDDGWKMLLRE